MSPQSTPLFDSHDMARSINDLNELIAPLINAEGYDVEKCTITSSNQGFKVIVSVDQDGGVTVDDLAQLTAVIDPVIEVFFGENRTNYQLDISSRGLDTPLTVERHWRCNQGRKVAITLKSGEKVTGRIGIFSAENNSIDIVAATSGKYSSTIVYVSQIEHAVLEVDFTKPHVSELKRCGITGD